MTYRELIEFCYNKLDTYCPKCEHRNECQVFEFETEASVPSELYKIVYSKFDLDAEIEV